MHGHGGYDSDFSDDEQGGESKKKKKTVEDELLLTKPFQKENHGKVHKQVAADLLDREEARNRRFHLIAMDAYQRHTKFVNDYILYYGGKREDFKRLGENDKTDLDVIRENHRFLWNEEDETDMTWEKRLAKKYYDKLFKEYCIADLSRYKENKVYECLPAHMCTMWVPVDTRRGCQLPRTGGTDGCDPLWMLATKLGSSAAVLSTLNSRAISSAPSPSF